MGVHCTATREWKMITHVARAGNSIVRYGGIVFFSSCHRLTGMKTLAKILATFFLVALALFFTGCSAPVPVPVPVSPGQTTEFTPQPTATADTAFLSLYTQSSGDVAARILNVNSKFYTSSTDAGLTYSPANLRMAALDMSTTADAYHNTMLGLKNFASQSNELKRNEYLGYLNSISTAGKDIADASSAESTNQYRLAMNYAEMARTALDRIEGVPDPQSADAIETMQLHLDDYIQIMRGKLQT